MRVFLVFGLVACGLFLASGSAAVDRLRFEPDLIGTMPIFLSPINCTFDTQRCNAVAELGIQRLADNLDPFSIGSFNQHDGVNAMPHQPYAAVSMLGARSIVFGGYFFFVRGQGFNNLATILRCHMAILASAALPQLGNLLAHFNGGLSQIQGAR